MKNLRKFTSFLLVTAMAAGMIVPGNNAQAAKKKVKLNKKAVTLVVGKKATLKVKNAPKGKKITWSSNKKKIAAVSKKGVVTAKKAGTAKITAKVAGKKYVCKVTVKKKAKAKATATPKDATKTTKPTVTKQPSTVTPDNPETPVPSDKPDNSAAPVPTDQPNNSVTPAPTATAMPAPTVDPVEKNVGDVAALQNIIEEQNANGANLPTDLDDNAYSWDENGRLTRIDWWYA